jgi:integrase
MPLNMANLERRGNRLYVVKTIPPSLRAIAGKKHLRKATGTGDLQVACRRRAQILAEFERQLQAWRTALLSGPAQDASLEEAHQLGDWVRAGHLGDDEDGLSVHLAEELALRAAPKWVTSLDDVESLPPPQQRRISRIYNMALGARTMVDLLDAFLKHKTLKERTKQEYRRDIECFLVWSNVSRPEEVDLPMAYRYSHEHLPASGVKRATISRHVTTLSSFWRWMRKPGVVAFNPWPDQQPERAPEESRIRHEFLPDPQFVQLLQHFPEGDPAGDLIRLLALTGMRREEVATHAKLEDVGGLLCLTVPEGVGKTINAARSVPVHPDLRGVVVRRWGAGTSSPFPEISSPVPGDVLSKRVQHYVKATFKPEKKVTLHGLRGWNATHLERTGCRPELMEFIQGRSRKGLGSNRYSRGRTEKQMFTAIRKLKLPTA